MNQTPAQAMYQAARELGVGIGIRGTCVTIVTRFPVGDKKRFCELDMLASNVLDAMPARGGSTWGTDGGSIGGAVALQDGIFRMNRTGYGKRHLAELAKMITTQGQPNE